MSAATEKAWQNVGKRHHHGIQVPLLSLRTEKSCGNGEFLDLLPLIDWLSSIGMDVLQLLPLNDSALDPSPYNAISSTALHPIYLSLHALPYATDLDPFRIYNETKRVAYREVLELKLAYLKTYIAKHQDTIQANPEYLAFIQKSPHLIDYALYKSLQEKHHGKAWIKWPRADQLKQHPLDEEAIFHLMVQFLCHEQLKTVKARAEKKGILLKGDIPILISPDSADVWAHQEFFDLSKTAGSPPNPFDPPGQNWKFPLYNWKAMEENHFEWWRKRIEIATNYFHLYRVDHILGFFRIWAIPHGKTPSEGHFIPQDLGLMKAQGEKLLSTLASFSEMLPIGEDIGDPPPFVRTSMNDLGIPGTKIFRYCRNWKTDHSFIPFEDYPPCSIASVSTHDLEPLPLWWRNHPDAAEDFAHFKGWTYQKQLSLKHHEEILRDIHHCGSLFHVNLLQEYLALMPELTWDNPQDEQINIPGTESDFNWTYRYKLPLETLTRHTALKKQLRHLID
ncbi:MAG: 4-alpha-glucanotransferase [Chlamydiia bacterium]|nr:4-alpha-glucanotransferase [Chlamydiia bacterium]